MEIVSVCVCDYDSGIMTTEENLFDPVTTTYERPFIYPRSNEVWQLRLSLIKPETSRTIFKAKKELFNTIQGKIPINNYLIFF